MIKGDERLLKVIGVNSWRRLVLGYLPKVTAGGKDTFAALRMLAKLLVDGMCVLYVFKV
jgi:hypothetical protein